MDDASSLPVHWNTFSTNIKLLRWIIIKYTYSSETMIYLSISISSQNLIRGGFILRHYYSMVNLIIFLLRHRYVIVLGLVSMRMKMVNHGFYFVEFWLLVGLYLKLDQIIQVGSLWPGNEMELDFETKVCPLKRNKGYLTRKWWWNYVFLKYYFRSA